MKKIKKIIIGTNNPGKYKELSDFLPKTIQLLSPKKLKIASPEENGKSFKENSFIKASYFSKKINEICLSDDSGLEIDLLKGAPGIYSSRWCGEKNNFNLAINKVFQEMIKVKKDWKNNNRARFICCLTLFFPNGKFFSSKGIARGQILNKKKGNKGFGYDPIFVPDGYNETFGEMNNKLKSSIDHRFKAFEKIKFFFN